MFSHTCVLLITTRTHAWHTYMVLMSHHVQGFVKLNAAVEHVLASAAHHMGSQPTPPLIRVDGSPGWSPATEWSFSQTGVFWLHDILIAMICHVMYTLHVMTVSGVCDYVWCGTQIAWWSGSCWRMQGYRSAKREGRSGREARASGRASGRSEEGGRPGLGPGMEGSATAAGLALPPVHRSRGEHG